LGPAVISFRRRYHCPSAGAFLTGLATAVGPASRRGTLVGAMLPLLRLPLFILSPSGEFLALCESITARLRGAAPRSRQGEAPARAGADPDGLRGLPGFPRSLTLEILARACADPLFERPRRGGRSPSAWVALALYRQVTEHIYDTPTGRSLLGRAPDWGLP
jgi:hypothetical protein